MPLPRSPFNRPASGARLTAITCLLACAFASPTLAAEPQLWSLLSLTRPTPPAVKDTKWPRNPIDRFILARLEASDLRPSPPASRRDLIRRLSYDLTGLPPTPDEVAAFEKDSSPDAYEKLVDRLLASPRYGERWARHWLDVVHYADTHGYDKDKRRDNAWPYRDYVIFSLNADKPYARFIREQIAGDVLFAGSPDATIATGFLAAGPWDFVGHAELGPDSTDGKIARLLDRDDMVANVCSTFLSVTAHCARCHDHKFDPISQRDYYSMQAVFAGVTRGDRPYPQDPQTQRRRADLEKSKAALIVRKADLLAQAESSKPPKLREIERTLAELKTQLAAQAGPAASPTNGYHSAISNIADTTKWVQIDLGKSVPIDEIRLIPSRPTDFPDTPGFGFPKRFTLSLSDDPDFKNPTIIDDHSAADFPNPGDTALVIKPKSQPKARYLRLTATRLWERTSDYVLALAELQVLANGANIASAAKVTALDSIEAGRWSTKHLTDGYSSRARLAPINPRFERLRADLDQLDSQIRQLSQDLLDPALKLKLSRVSEDLADTESALVKLPPPAKVYAPIPAKPVPIHILRRGDVNAPKDEVHPGALSALTHLPSEFNLPDLSNEGPRRSALADWVADDRNPLTWRSIANRLWHYHFGRGIVDTPNDFGRKGGVPSHPELLDYLASELLAHNGSLKHLHRLIVTSSTYRQSSAANPDAEKLDADNRLLWHFTRQRLDAESIRDSLLLISGQLDPTMFGPAFNAFDFKDDHSPHYDYATFARTEHPETSRRSIYRFTVRSVGDPFMEAMDCADPNISTPARASTNTALQALALLNDPFILQQSRHLATRLQSQSPDLETQITHACLHILSRPPTQRERDSLTRYAQSHGLSSACRLLFNTSEFLFLD